MTAIFAWICAAVAALATLGAAYFFDKSAEEGIVKAEEHAAHANSLAGEAHERAAALEKEAARAKADLAATQAEIEKSKLAIAQADQRAAEATAKAKEAELALAKLKTPRLLNEEQAAEFVSMLKKYNDERYWKVASTGLFVALVTQTYEATALAGQLIELYNAAGLHLFRGIDERVIAGAGVITNGVGITYSRHRQVEKEFAEAFAGLLNKSGIEAAAIPTGDENYDVMNSKTKAGAGIVILIGDKW